MWAWSVYRLLSGQEPRHHQCGSAGEGLSGQWQYRAQHHHRARQLLHARQLGVLFPFAEAVEGLESELNYNVMHSQRGQLILAHSDGQRDTLARRGNAMINQGDDAELWTRDQVRDFAPYLDFEQTRFPIYGGLMHHRGGTARHDAVAWGYARGADRRGVDLIQNCEVTGIYVVDGKVTGVQTSRGAIRAKKVAIIVAGGSSS